MTQIVWDQVGSRTYETGVDRGVLYLPNIPGVPWNGLVTVSEAPDGGEITSYWLDGVKYLDVIGGEEYKGTIEAFTYPDEFEICQGIRSLDQGIFATAQPRQSFGLAYRSKVGNDVDGMDHGYKIHLIYNATVAPLSRDYATLSGSVDLAPLKWDIIATPAPVPGMKPTAHIIIDSRTMDAETLASVEELLYGSDQIPSHLPTVSNLINLISTGGEIDIIDNGDGTWTAIAPNEYISMLDDETFQIVDANATFIDDNTYTIQSST